MTSNSNGKVFPVARPSYLVDFILKECGGIPRISEDLGISRSAVQQWKNNGIPPSRVRSLVRLSNGKVSPEDMRPDIFGVD